MNKILIYIWQLFIFPSKMKNQKYFRLVGSNSSHSVSEVCDGENLWQSFRLEKIGLASFIGEPFRKSNSWENQNMCRQIIWNCWLCSRFKKIFTHWNYRLQMCETYYEMADRVKEAVAQMCSVKKVFLKISQNSQGNTCARVLF